jgi:hypothetical protein
MRQRDRDSSVQSSTDPEQKEWTMKLHSYLKYGGNCAQAFRFYEKHLGGKITMMMTRGAQRNAKDVPPDQKDAILYARMSIGETDLMGSDLPSERFQPMRSLLPLREHHRRSRAYFCSAFRSWRDICGDAGDVLCQPICDSPRYIWNVSDDH